jgi:hypothetical protein
MVKPSAPEYVNFITDLKARIALSRNKAARAVNRELIRLYWDIGAAIVDRQRYWGWGKSVVVMMAKDLGRAFPETAGFSALNLWRMRAFYLAYSGAEGKLSQPATEPASEKLSQPVTEMADPLAATPLPKPLDALPRGHPERHGTRHRRRAIDRHHSVRGER